MPVIQFEKERVSLDVLPGTNLRKAALKSGIHLYKPFFRVFHANIAVGPLKLPCGADIVEIEGKGTNQRSPEEEAAISGRYLIKRKVAPNLRLACQVQVTGDIAVKTSPRLEVDARETKRQIGFVAVVGVFVLLLLAIFVMIGLDLVQKI